MSNTSSQKKHNSEVGVLTPDPGEHFSVWLSNLETDNLAVSSTPDVNARDLFGDLSVDDLCEVFECLELMNNVWSASPAQTGSVGPYHLIRKLGTGGMGEVWEAEQHEPIQRKLAIKFVRSELVSDGTRARFSAERKLLAMLEHPNIARVLDAGSCNDGQLFLAMELVAGKPITEFCKTRNLGLDERIRLFIDVCAGVRHAHQKAIIHRDLKPSNVLVSNIDDRPVPKVIDFGLAKLLDSPLESGQRPTENSLASSDGQLLGTLPYMSPEQASMGAIDVDTRADVYSLGVLLFELLVDDLPIRPHKNNPGSHREFLRRICSEIPPAPSERLRTAQQQTPANHRRSTVEPPSQELDWVTMKAIEKDPSARYSTVAEFAADLERYLQAHPVLAGPASRRYRFRKFLQRHKKSVLATLLLFILLTLGIIGTTWGWVQSSRAKASAERNLRQAKNSNKILTDIFGDLDIESIEQADKPIKMVFASRLISAGKQLTDSKIDSPVDVAEMQLKLAHSLIALGFPNDAVPLCKSAYSTLHQLKGFEARITRDAARELSLAHQGAGQLPEANEVLDLVVEFCEQKLPELDSEALATIDQSASLKYLEGDYESATALYRTALAGRKQLLGPNEYLTMKSAYGLGSSLVATFNTEEAIPVLEEGLQYRRKNLPPNHPETIKLLSDLAWAYGRSGSREQESIALKLAEEGFELATETFGQHHRQTYFALLQVCISKMGKSHSDLIPGLKTAAEGLADTCGRSHPKTVIATSVLAREYQKSGRPEWAIPLIEKNLEVRQQKLPSGHSTITHGLRELADAYSAIGNHSKSKELLLQVLSSDSLPSRQRLSIELKLAELLIETAEFELAIGYLKSGRAKLITSNGPIDFDTMLATADLGKALALNREFDAAINLLRQYRVELAEEVGPRSVMSAIITAQLGIVLSQAGQLEEGIELMESIVNSRRRLKKMDYLVRELRTAYQTANMPERLKQSLDMELSFYRNRLDPTSALYAERLSELGFEAIRFKQWEFAKDVLAISLETRHNQKLPNDDTSATDNVAQWNTKLTEFHLATAELAIDLADRDNPSRADKPKNGQTTSNSMAQLLDRLDEAYQQLEPEAADRLPMDAKKLALSVGCLSNLLESAKMAETAHNWRTKINAKSGF